MAGEYGFTYYKRQFRWVSSEANMPIGEPEFALFTAAPRSLVELRGHWASEAAQSQNILRFTCTWLKDNSWKTKYEWSLDSEEDFQRALKFVHEGEPVILTVITARDTLTDSEGVPFEGMEKCPPEWFTEYMKKFRSELMDEIGQLIEDKLTKRHPHHHHGHHHSPKHGSHGHGAAHKEVHKEILSSADFKCMKIEKKLQKLQNRTQKMSLELDDTPETSHHKHKGERRLGKINKRMEQLEAKRCKIMARKVCKMPMESREELAASAPVYQEPQYENLPIQVENVRPARKYDAIVLKEGKPSLVSKMENGSLYSTQWIIKNVGEMPWDEKTILRLAHASAGITVSEQTIPAPILQPGEQSSIEVSFQVPSHPGLFECYFHFYQAEERFGHVLRCSFSVDPIPGEKGLESTSVCSNNTLTQHPFIKEIQEANLGGSVVQEKDKGEYDSDHDDDDDDDDDISSESDESDSFVHIPMPPCYQYRVDKAEEQKEGETSLATAGSSLMSAASSVSASPPTPASRSCKTPPTTPKNAESDDDNDDEPTSDTTQIKYPVLDLKELTSFPIFPNQRAESRDKASSPVQILPETLVTGAMNVAAKAFSSAEAIMRSLQGSTSSVPSVVAAAVTPDSDAASGPAPKRTTPEKEEPASMTDPRTQNLITLADMGFFDDRLNEMLLDRYKDSLQEVVAELLLRQGRTAH